MQRRAFLRGLGAALLWPVLGSSRTRAEDAAALPEPTGEALEQSEFVYVSPLRSDGTESTCHGEVWYGWLDGAVVIITGSTAWKSTAVSRGLDRARIWVGNYGRWKKLLGRNEDFRRGPHFEARAEFVEGAPELVDRLLAVYDRKYPDEIGSWRERMRNGYRDGSRKLIRYVPLAASRT